MMWIRCGILAWPNPSRPAQPYLLCQVSLLGRLPQVTIWSCNASCLLLWHFGWVTQTFRGHCQVALLPCSHTHQCNNCVILFCYRSLHLWLVAIVVLEETLLGPKEGLLLRCPCCVIQVYLSGFTHLTWNRIYRKTSVTSWTPLNTEPLLLAGCYYTFWQINTGLN